MSASPMRESACRNCGAELAPGTRFCGHCGAAIYSCRGDDPPFYWLRTGAIRQRAELVPMAQGFCDTAMPWATDLSGVRVIPTDR